MAEIEKSNAKQRILDAAISLFAQKGYSAVGVREIAAKAGVNIAMISYYFNGKVGILREILSAFHNQYYQIIQDSIEEGKDPQECVRAIVRNVVLFIKRHTEITLVAFNAMPLDIPEIADLKADRVSQLIQAVSGLFKQFDLDSNDAVLLSVVGPALLSIVLTHFRFRSIQKEIFKVEFDETFYERYIETIGTLFLYGLAGIGTRTRKKRSG